MEIPPFSIEEVGACLKRNTKSDVTAEEIDLVSALSCGSVGTAETLLHAGYYKTLMDEAFTLCLSDLDRLPVAAKKAGATKNKKELVSLLRLVFRDAEIIKLGKSQHVLLKPEKERLTAVSKKYSHGALLLAQERLSGVEKELIFNANFAQCIELFMARVQNKE